MTSIKILIGWRFLCNFLIFMYPSEVAELIVYDVYNPTQSSVAATFYMGIASFPASFFAVRLQ
jgi:hypothetical protein